MNPWYNSSYFSEQEVRLSNAMRLVWEQHVYFTTKEVLFILQNNFQSSIAVFDKIEAQALQMADTITNAIGKQFPKKFQI